MRLVLFSAAVALMMTTGVVAHAGELDNEASVTNEQARLAQDLPQTVVIRSDKAGNNVEVMQLNQKLPADAAAMKAIVNGKFVKMAVGDKLPGNELDGDTSRSSYYLGFARGGRGGRGGFGGGRGGFGRGGGYHGGYGGRGGYARGGYHGGYGGYRGGYGGRGGYARGGYAGGYYPGYYGGGYYPGYYYGGYNYPYAPYYSYYNNGYYYSYYCYCQNSCYYGGYGCGYGY